MNENVKITYKFTHKQRHILTEYSTTCEDSNIVLEQLEECYKMLLSSNVPSVNFINNEVNICINRHSILADVITIFNMKTLLLIKDEIINKSDELIKEKDAIIGLKNEMLEKHIRLVELNEMAVGLAEEKIKALTLSKKYLKGDNVLLRDKLYNPCYYYTYKY